MKLNKFEQEAAREMAEKMQYQILKQLIDAANPLRLLYSRSKYEIQGRAA